MNYVYVLDTRVEVHYIVQNLTEASELIIY